MAEPAAPTADPVAPTINGELALLIEQFDLAIRTPDDVAQLKQLILQLAVMGKLVPQDPADEPAATILERHAGSTSNRKSSAGNQKPSRIGNDDPFDIPATWEWTSLSKISEFNVGKTPSTKRAEYWDNDGGLYWVSISDMSMYGRVLDTKRRISKLATSEVVKNGPAPAGTLLMSFKLTVGKVSVLGVDAYHNEAIISIYPSAGVAQDYLYWFLPLFSALGTTKGAIKGATLNSKSLKALPIPLPPTAEQHRIVAKVDELFALADEVAARAGAAEAARGRLLAALVGRGVG